MTTRRWLRSRLDALVDHFIPLACTASAGVVATLDVDGLIVGVAVAITALTAHRVTIRRALPRQMARRAT